MAIIENIEFKPSPTFSSRNGMDVFGVCIHYTAGGSAKGSISWLCNKDAKASAHFVISRKGKITQLVDTKYRAFHVGVGEMVHPKTGETIGLPDRGLIGIELANHGLLHRFDNEFYYTEGRTPKLYNGPNPIFAELTYDNGYTLAGYWEPYNEQQLEALQELLCTLSIDYGYKDAANSLVGHEDIAMPLTRKSDPGPLFPWSRFFERIVTRTSAKLI